METKIKRIILCVTTLLLSVLCAYIGMVLLMESELDFSKRLLYAICFCGYPICTFFLIVIIIRLIKMEPEREMGRLLKIWKILRVFTILFALSSAFMGQILIGKWFYDKDIYRTPFLMIPVFDSSLGKMSLHKENK